RQHSAPRMPEEVHAVETERAADGVDLLDEQLDGPVERSRRDLRATGADLVVGDRSPARLGEAQQRLEGVTRRSRPAAPGQGGQRARLGLAGLAVPGLEAAERDASFTHAGTVLPFRPANPAADPPTLRRVIRQTPERGGWLEVVCGPMFSGKSEELIRRLRRA